jgi:ribosomal protein S18 acetylase RimI-like enzyme
VRVRRATLEDAPRIARLRLALLAEHRSNPLCARVRRNAPARALALTQRQLADERQACFVATRGDRIVGVIRCVDERSHRLLLPVRHAYISTAYVEPAVRRSGIMRALLAAAIRWSRSRRLTQMRLHNAIDNPLAQATWDALGFRVVEQLRLRAI